MTETRTSPLRAPLSLASITSKHATLPLPVGRSVEWQHKEQFSRIYLLRIRNLPNDNYCYTQPQNGLLVLCSTTRLHIILYQVQHHRAQLDPAPHFLCLLTVLQLQHRTNISKYRIEANSVHWCAIWWHLISNTELCVISQKYGKL